MKKILNFSLFILLIMGVSSCSDDDAATNPQAPQGQLVAEVDGTPFSSNSTNTGAFYYQNMLSLSGTNTLGTILLTVPEITAAGTFDLSLGSTNDSFGTYVVTGEDGYLSEAENGGSGQLIITKFDLENNLISGTFEFTAIRHNVVDPQNSFIETVVISNGSFTDVEMIIDDIPGNANNSLSAMVDGVNYIPSSVHAQVVTMSGQSNIMVTSNNTTTNQNVSLTIPSDVTVGTHSFTSMPGSGINGNYSPDIGNSNIYFVSISGSITITNYDVANGTMEGTFFFTAGDFMQQDPATFEITNGVFDIEF